MNIRKEYSYVDDNSYRVGRTDALKKLISQEKLFDSEMFTRYEEMARQNLKKEVSQLENK